MTAKPVIEIIAAFIMLIGLVGIFWNRYTTRKGIGKRIIQLAGVIFLIPVILILALENILTVELIGTLLGTIVGYVLSDLAKDDSAE